MKLRTLADVEQALRPYYEVAAETVGRGLTVERTERLMAHLGNPEQSLQVIHIAGTSGKTSTTYYIAALLTAAGKRVGSTVSPHVDSLTERVQLQGEPLDETVFCTYMTEFLPLVQTAPERPSWFELMIAFALWVFSREQVEYAVLETGLGGLHDSTNVAARPDKLCVLTDIGLDHVRILGKTTGQIAAQKAGIIHPGNAVLMYGQSPEIMQAVRFKVSQTPGAELYVQDQALVRQVYAGSFASDLPHYQERNWLLAYAAYRFLARRDHLPRLEAPVLRATQLATPPARMEIRRLRGVDVIMDGAHNEAKMRACVESFTMRYPGRRVPVLMAMKRDKQYTEAMPWVTRVASEIIATSFDVSQDWPIASVPPKKLVAEVGKHTDIPTRVIQEPVDALRQLLQSGSDLVVVTGSFYLIGQLREAEAGLR